VLPARVREPATAVYAFRSVLADVVDRPGATATALRALEERVAAAFDGRPEEHPVDRAFSAVVVEQQVPRALFDAMLEGFGWDLAGRRYATYEALLAHAARTAATVAACMAILMDRRQRDVVARACDLGVAMQLTSVARDVGDDARRGRLYLPLEWMEEARVDVDRFVMSPAPTRGVRDVVLRLLRAADPLYTRAEVGIAALPADCRPAVRAARLLHAALGDELQRGSYDAVTRRAEVRPLDQARLVARALRPLPGEGHVSLDRPPLEAARPLVDAVVGS
jgi:phytoene synthase